ASDINNLFKAAQVPPVITRAVVNPGTVFKGASVSFDVWAEGGPTLGYMWYSNGIATGLTSTNITLNNFAVAASDTIYVAVTNAFGSNYSSVTFPVVAAKPNFVQQPKPVWRFVGRPFTFSVVMTGS